jgi:tagatose-1,6-bisphosphate aldolase
MAAENIQQILEYLRANPDVAKKARDYVMTHPGQIKEALKEVAEKRGWDLSKIDLTALTTEFGKLKAA